MSSVTVSMDADRDDYKPRLVTYQGANNRELEVVIKESGSVKDLTEMSASITARDGGTSGTVKIGQQTMTIADPATGVATFTPTATQVADAGEFDAQVMLDGGGSHYDYTQVFRLVVLPVVDVRMYPLDGDGTEYTLG